MGTIYRRPAARRDLIAHFAYLPENADETIAGRFLANAETSFNDLVQQPLMGKLLRLQHTALIGVRKWRIKGFDNYLIFYRPHPDGVSILRVLHASQDWWGLFGLEIK